MPTTSPSPLRGVARLLRAGFVGTWTILLALVGHRLGGGEWAPLVVLVPLALGATALAWWLTGRRLRMPVVALLIGAAQLVVHLMTCYLHDHLMAPSVLMLLGHASAAVLCAAALARADRIWWALVAPIVALLRWVLAPTPWRARVHRSPGVLAPRQLVLAHAVARRGPPLA